MMKQALWMALLLSLVAVWGLPAADVSGKWVAQIPGRQGATVETVFNFKVEGGKLTGTVTTGQGEFQISEGTVSGESISFVVVRPGRDGGQIKDIYKGTVAGNEIKFTRTREGAGGGGGGPLEFVAKRAS